MSQSCRHVLDGVKVLDFTQMLAGPAGSRAMAEMGAEVLKIEAPGGDHLRQFPYRRDERSAHFIQQNRGKKSLCVDLKSERGRELVAELIPHVDVLIENFTPGTIGRLGFAYDVVRELNPQIIMCSLSAFGQTGPLAAKPGYDYIAQAYSGVASMIGDPDGPPSLVGLGIGDVMTGMHAVAAITAALFHRERTGRGQYVEVSLLDALFHCHEVNVQIHTASGGLVKPTRSGSQHPQVTPVGIFPAADGYLFLAVVTDRQWPMFCRAMGRPELATDERYAAVADRFAHRDEVVDLVETWLAGLTVEEAVRVLEAEWVPVGPIQSVEQAVNHPHLRERGTVQPIEDRVLGSFEIPRMPLRFPEMDEPLTLDAPFLGEHTEAVLAEYLGYGPAEYRALLDDGVVSEGPT